MSTNTTLPYVVALGGAFALGGALRRRARIPSYVHAVALGIGIVSAVVLWRSGGLPGGLIPNSVTLLIPSAAIYFFFFQFAKAREAASDD